MIEGHRPILEAIIDKDAERARHSARSRVNLCKSSLDALVEQQSKRRG